MAEQYSWVWQRRTAIAVSLAAASYAAGLLWSFKATERQTTLGESSSSAAIADSLNFRQGQAQAQTLAIAESGVLNRFATRVAQFDVQQKQIYSYAVPKQFQGQTIKDVSIPGNRKVIALTFDDGPWPKYTNDILYILEKNNIKATFFLLGRNVQNMPGIARKIVDSGHVVANHSWDHPYRQHNREAAARQIDRTDDIIYKTTGVKSVLFRPPGGILKNGLAAYAASKKQVVVMWSADSQDYRASTAAQIRNVMRDAGQGGIVLMHDGGGNRPKTVAALPVIIEKLRSQGYEFVTLPELLDLKAKGAQTARAAN